MSSDYRPAKITALVMILGGMSTFGFGGGRPSQGALLDGVVPEIWGFVALWFGLALMALVLVSEKMIGDDADAESA